jgi:SNF2 family DNA or RNA helicase
MTNLTKKEISVSFDNATFGRGEAYYHQDRVQNLLVEVIDDDYVILRSQVRGSGYVYTVEVSVEHDEPYNTDIVGECSCPVGYNCKHTVATCLAYLAYNPKKSVAPQNKADIWLGNLIVANKGEPQQVADHAEFVAYLLDAGEQPGQIEVKLVESRISQRGGRTKGRRLDLDDSFASYYYATPADHQVISLLKLVRKGLKFHSSPTKLSGELGAVCLQAMVNTGRCYWQATTNPAFTEGGPRAVHIGWHESDDDMRQLRIVTEPAAVVLDVSPPLYLDIDVFSLGTIEEDSFNASEWHLLLNAPLISAEHAEEFSQKLVTALPNSLIPPPLSIQMQQVSGVTPRPCLTLRSEPSAFSGSSIHLALMHFEYDTWVPPVFPALPVQRFVTENGIVSLSRDLLYEQSCIDELKNHNLAAQVVAQGFLSWAPEDFSPIAQTEVWRNFLNVVVPALESSGWLVAIEDEFTLEFVEADDWKVEVESESGWFELGFNLNVDGEEVQLLPLMTRLLQEHDIEDLPEVVSIPMGEDRYLQLSMDQLKPVYQVLYEMFDQTLSKPGSSPRFSRYDAMHLVELDERLDTNIVWQGGENLRQIGARLKNFEGIERVKLPKDINVELREYQHQGVDWLQFLREYEFNGILADDMGLGKTVQTLVHIQIEKEADRLDRPCLIIAPTSLMSNWRREVEKFTPGLRVLTLQGSMRHARFEEMNDYDIVLSTYPLVVRDQELLLASQYHYLILDEAQMVKNPRSKVARLVRMITTRHRLCLTGTPMENHLGELWAQFDFLMPGFLGDTTAFTKRFRTPIEKHGDEDQQKMLSRRIAPFMLRRRKNDVLTELPPKTEMIRMVTFEPAQAALYESIRLSMEKRVREAVREKGFARSHITILDALLKLRQTCCDPGLLKLDEARKVKSSAKLELLMEMLDEMLSKGRRILVFSQFTQMLGIIEQKLNERDIVYTKLTGQTRNRDRAIEAFRTGEADLFLISLKAGGVGLNLTEADTVIHYDPWWNPATENQATDRAHRIGQDKPVFVYKLITENTLEEKIVDMQSRKQDLADGVYQNVDVEERFDVTLSDLEMLLSPQGL